MLMFQLAREVWWYESPFPLSAMGYLVEPLYLTRYRHVPVLTISKSTEGDLRRLGFKGPITVLPIGIEEVTVTPEAKADTPTFLYVGRLAPSKRIAHMLQALAQFRAANGNGVLWLVGSGSESLPTVFGQAEQRILASKTTSCFGVACQRSRSIGSWLKRTAYS